MEVDYAKDTINIKRKDFRVVFPLGGHNVYDKYIFRNL